MKLELDVTKLSDTQKRALARVILDDVPLVQEVKIDVRQAPEIHDVNIDLKLPQDDDNDGIADSGGAHDAAGDDGSGSDSNSVVDNDSGDELDSNGHPWDARIHASTKTKTTKGEWKKRRGVDEVTYGNVIAELEAGDEPVLETFKSDEPEPVMHADTGDVPDAATLFEELNKLPNDQIANAWAHIGVNPSDMGIIFNDGDKRVKMMEFIKNATA